MNRQILVVLFTQFFCLICTASGQNGNSVEVVAGEISVEVVMLKGGLYKLMVELPESRADHILLNHNNYLLRDSKSKSMIDLPEPEPWNRLLGKGVLFKGVAISYEGKYTFEAFGCSANIDKDNYTDSNIKSLHVEFEKGRALGWQRSISSKVVQNEDDDDGFADLGFNLAIHNELPGKFNFRFEGSVTTDKEDPTNHWLLQLDWRTRIWLPSFAFGMRPLNLSLTETADQPLDFHDLYCHAFTTIYLRPFKGIQPVFISAGAGESVQKEKKGDWYNEPRAFLRVQWMMAGLVGKGSRLFFEWHHWDVIDFMGHPNLYPDIEKKRSLVEIEFVLPFIENKNLRLKYADGDVAPTYSDITSVEVGFEILFGDDAIYRDK